MTLLQRLATALLTLAVAAAVGAGAWWLVTNKPATKTADKPAPGATVAKVVKEDDLDAVVLTEAAEKRLGLTVALVEAKAVRRVRVYGGEVTVPAGRTILVAAPLGGTLKAPSGRVPAAGSRVKAGQPVFHLTPLLTPDGRATLAASLVEAEGQVNNAKAQVELARIALGRAERVFKGEAGSQRLVDEARTAFEVATKTADAAAARQAILRKVVGDADGGTAAPVPIDAPEDGILRAVSALPGQTVPSGAALFEVVDLSAVWVRVPLPVGDLDGVDRRAAAEVGKLSAPPGVKLASARPVAAPPSGNPLAATVDVFYELPNADGALVPGQRLGVTVPLTDAKEGPTVPWSAVVFDIHGGTWVYAQTAPRTYARRRVVVSHTAGPDAALASGPAVGTKVVTAGVQELFGAETGFVK
ncbi:MAG: efflux RND transporter periplasmic adaptor subunit [Gemmataceae bacterium]|nr:efflux RND transporter periplasmic adaptor subunit [Gemmataceae bacterium]